MSDPVQDMEQLIRAYTQELMRMSRQRPAPEEATQPEDTPPEDVPPEDVPPEDVPPEDVPPEDVPPEDVPPEDAAPETIASTPDVPRPEKPAAETAESPIEVTIAAPPVPTACGQLQIQVYAAAGAIPLEGAVVTPRRQEDPDLTEPALTTDRSGFTLAVELPVGAYYLDIGAAGFSEARDLVVDVVEGTLTALSAELTPLPE